MYFSEGSWKHLETWILSPRLRDWMLQLHQMLLWLWRCCAYPIQQGDHFKNHFNDHFKSCKKFFCCCCCYYNILFVVVIVIVFVSTFVLPFSEMLETQWKNVFTTHDMISSQINGVLHKHATLWYQCQLWQVMAVFFRCPDVLFSASIESFSVTMMFWWKVLVLHVRRRVYLPVDNAGSLVRWNPTNGLSYTIFCTILCIKGSKLFRLCC